MKKSITLIVMLVWYISANAQNYLHMNVTEVENLEELKFCKAEYDGILFSKDPTCNSWIAWSVRSFNYGISWDYDTDDITINPSMGDWLRIQYQDNCEIHWREFYVRFQDFQVTEPWSQDFIWKRSGTSTSLQATQGESLKYLWSTGATSRTINVTNPGTYWVRVYNDCGELYDTIQVRDNVEVELATCDLETNLNMVTWPTTPAQAEYVSQVEVKRDGLVVGTAPYTDGSFTDNIGSEAASRTYTVLAVAPDGTDCPILSHPKETIHMTYTLGVGNTIVIGWNHPTGYELVGYNICEWNPGAKDDELTVIDYVGAGVSSYTCSESQFDHGMIVVQGVERTKDAESRLLSNRSLDYVGLGEKENKIFNLYPNPTTGRVTIEGTGRLTITNGLGQTILTRDITDTETIDLPMGVWLVKLDGATRKVVVE